MPLTIQGMPGTCAIDVYTSLGADGVTGSYGPVDIATVKAHMAMRDKKNDFTRGNAHLLLATVAPDQAEAEKVLLSLGWKVLAEFRNPRHPRPAGKDLIKLMGFIKE